MDNDYKEEAAGNTEGMTKEEVMARDMKSSAGSKQPKKTWFFLRTGDGTIFAAEEKEAWEIINVRSTWRRHDFKLVGVSDGKTYAKFIEKSRGRADALKGPIEDAKKQLEQYRRAEEKMLIDDAIDMDDLEDPVNAANVAKVNRMKGIIKKLEAKLDGLEAEFRDVTRDVVKKATEAEIAVARGNIEWPSEMNIITPGADRKQRRRILNAMGQGE